MPVINLKHNFLFACNPGTGSTAISRALVKQFDSSYFPEDSVKVNDLVIEWKHGLLKHIKMYDLIDDQTFENLFKFVFVRNPYTFLLSDYIRHRQWKELLDREDSWISSSPRAQERVKIANSCSFQEYLVWKNKNRRIDEKVDLFTHQVECTNKIYKLENMDDFVIDFENKFGMKLVISRVNKTKSSTEIEDNNDLLTQSAIDYINKVYEPTFIRYNYQQL